VKLIDISPLIDPTINVWPGDTAFSHTVNLDMHAGANITLSEIRTTVHVGAHADAPSHYVADGADIASVELEPYIGPCAVITIDAPRGQRIVPASLGGRAIESPRILLRTGTFPDPRRWNTDFASLSPELVDWMHERSVVLIGVDSPSVDPFDSKALEAHQAFARNGMAILEGLTLDGVPDGNYELIALPLRIKGADASPVRAVLRQRESTTTNA
jgi:arylformamidase